MADGASGEAERVRQRRRSRRMRPYRGGKQTIDHLKEKGWDCAVEIGDGVCRK